MSHNMRKWLNKDSTKTQQRLNKDPTKTQQRLNKDSNQSSHLCSLIRVFVVHSLIWIFNIRKYIFWCGLNYFLGTILPGAGGSRSPRMSNGDIDEFDDRFREVGISLCLQYLFKILKHVTSSTMFLWVFWIVKDARGKFYFFFFSFWKV